MKKTPQRKISNTFNNTPSNDIQTNLKNLTVFSCNHEMASFCTFMHPFSHFFFVFLFIFFNLLLWFSTNYFREERKMLDGLVSRLSSPAWSVQLFVALLLTKPINSSEYAPSKTQISIFMQHGLYPITLSFFPILLLMKFKLEEFQVYEAFLGLSGDCYLL